MAFLKPDVNMVWAESGGIVTPATAKINLGWVAEIPDFEFENWIQNRQDQFNAHVNQYGIPVWDSVTEYIADKSYVQGSDGFIYRALSTHTNSAPPSANWVRAFNEYNFSYSRSESDTLFLTKSGNLSELTNKATARANLVVYSKTESDARYLNEASNLSDLDNITTARTNLGVYAKTEVYNSTESDARYLQQSNNLAELTNKATARTNLAVYSKTESDGRYYSAGIIRGMVAPFAGTPPAGWLVCDGAAVSRSTYFELFSQIGTTFGTGNGSTTFNLPDLRNEFIRGADSTTRPIGTKESDSLKSHTHTGTVNSGGSHSHTASTSSAGSHSHTASTGSAGNHRHTIGAYSSDKPSGSYLNADNVTNRTNYTGYAGAHTHTVTVNSGGAHTHTVTVNSNGAHTHTFTTNATGDTETRPRNIALLYAIKY